MNSWLINLGYMDLRHLCKPRKAGKGVTFRKSELRGVCGDTKDTHYTRLVLEKYNEGMNTTQISVELDVPRSTVYRILAKLGLCSNNGLQTQQAVRLVSVYDRPVNRLFMGLNEASRETGISSTSISHVCNGKRKITKGHIFKWENER